MLIETASVVAHDPVSGEYRMLTLKAPGVAASAQPGQFVHLRVPNLENSALRRPFSVFMANAENLAIMYKCVGVGTLAMTRLRPGDELSLMGPLGNGFPSARSGIFPVLVGGGYGVAALHLLAERSPLKGIMFIGAGSACNILCRAEFERLGWEMRIATEDGSSGRQGLVTEALDTWLAGEIGIRVPEFFACGPIGMLKAVAERAMTGGWNAWLSMERHMGCGMGACLGCVQKVKPRASATGKRSRPTLRKGTWEWARVCVDGPVFECRDIVWEDEGNSERGTGNAEL